MIDYHCHTKLCRHATGTMESYIKRAKMLNLRGMGFNDHFPMVFLRSLFDEPAIKEAPLEEYSMTFDEIPIYLEKVKYLQNRFQTSDFCIKLSFELDYVEDHDSEIKKIITPYLEGLDYLYGAIHFLYLDGVVVPFDDSRFLEMYKDQPADLIYSVYLDVLEKMVRSGIYDVVAHFDLPKKFNLRPKDKQKYADHVEEALSLIAESGMVLELNTAGLRKPVNEMYPERFILEKCYDKGISLIVGSDSHQPSEVGHAFEEARALLLEIGFEKTVDFMQRKKNFIDL